MVLTPSGSHYGEAVQEAVEVRAERLVAEGLAKLGWSEQDLLGRAKGHPGKVGLALELKANSKVPLAWIAERLNHGKPRLFDLAIAGIRAKKRDTLIWQYH